jgi:hypothetical protein
VIVMVIRVNKTRPHSASIRQSKHNRAYANKLLKTEKFAHIFVPHQIFSLLV